MRLFDIVVWVLFIGSSVFMFYFFTKRMSENKVKRQEVQAEYDQKKESYTYLKPGVFDDMPRADVSLAAVFHCARKEDEDFDGYFEKMNESEKIIYGVYQLTLSLEGKNPSLHSFFLSPMTKPYVPMLVDMFEKLGSHEIAELMSAARRFAEIIENDEEDDDEDNGDYSKYNFSDFTHEFVTLVSTTNLNEKLTDYILAHKEDFYDYDIPSDNQGDGDE